MTKFFIALFISMVISIPTIAETYENNIPYIDTSTYEVKGGVLQNTNPLPSKIMQRFETQRSIDHNTREARDLLKILVELQLLSLKNNQKGK